MKNTKGWAVKKCDICGHEMRRFRINKYGQIVCYSCSLKSITRIGVYKNIQEALEKIRTVIGHYQNKTGLFIRAQINVPTCLIGKKVKLILIEDDEDGKEEK